MVNEMMYIKSLVYNDYTKMMFLVFSLLVAVVPFLDIIEKVAILIFISIFLLLSNVIPAWYTSLLFVTSCIVGNIAEKKVILSGITSDAAWLVVSGIIIGAAIKYTKLDEVLAGLFVPLCKGRYSNVLFGTMLLGLILIFLMPSAMGRVVLLLPILNALSLLLGYDKGSKEWEGIIVDGVLSTYLPAFYVLPSNVTNNVFSGAISALYSLHISFSEYFLLFFPILGVGKILVIYFMLNFFYRKCKNPVNVPRQSISLTKRQRYLMALLVITLVFWLTEHIHQISAGWVGMATALFLLLPNFNFLEKQPLRKINFESFFFVSGIISIGSVAKVSGLASLIANYLISVVSLDSISLFEVSIFFVSLCIVLSFIVTLPGVPAVVTPLIEHISDVSNIPKMFFCNMEVIGFSNVFFPFQAPPLMVVLENENLSKSTMAIYCSIVSIVGLFLVLPLQLYWDMFFL